MPIPIFLRKNAEEIVKIELCKTGNCPEDVLAKKIIANINRQMDGLNQKIDALPEGSGRIEALQDSLAFLAQELSQKQTLIKEISKQIVRTDFETALPSTRRAIQYLEAVQIDSAIVVLESAKLKEGLNVILEEEQKLKEKQEDIERQKKEHIEGLMTLARSYVLNFRKDTAMRDSAIFTFERAVFADTSLYQNMYDYVSFLQSIKAYEKAQSLFTLLLKKPIEPWQRGNTLIHLGELAEEQGQFDQAIQRYEESFRLYNQLHKDYPDYELYAQNFAVSYSKLGGIFEAQGQLDSALFYYRSRNRLSEELYDSNPQSEKIKNGLAISYEKLGGIFEAQGQLDSALFYYEDETVLFKELYDSNPQSEKIKNGLAISYEKLGGIFEAQGQLDSALFYYQDETVLFKELYDSNPQSEKIKNGLAISYSKLGGIFEAQGQLDSALFYYRSRNRLSEELYDSNPQSEKIKNGLAISYEKLGGIFEAQGQLDSALFYYRSRNRLSEELYDSNPQSLTIYYGLGVSYFRLGNLYRQPELAQFDTARILVGKAQIVMQDLYERTGIERYTRLVQVAQNVLDEIEAELMSPAEKVEQAQAQIQRIETLMDSLPDEENRAYAVRVLASTYGSLSWHLLFDRRFTEAEQAARKGLEIGKNTPEEVEWIYTNLVTSLLFQERYPEAEGLYKGFMGKPYTQDPNKTWTEVFLEDLAALEKAGVTHPDVAKARRLLGD